MRKLVENVYEDNFCLLRL